MSGQVTDLLVAYAAGPPEEGCKPIGKIDASGLYLWFKYGEQDAITGVRVVDSTEAELKATETLIDANLNKNNAESGPLYFVVNRDPTPSAIVDLTLITSKMAVSPAGFLKVNTPLSFNPKTWLAYQTRAAKRKLTTNDYEVGDRCDCLDGSSWRTAKVQQVRVIQNIKQIHINFEGWDHKWDEWLPVSSSRLAPVGKHTKGKWTGGTPKPPFNLSDPENLEKLRDTSTTVRGYVDATSEGVNAEIEGFMAGDNKKLLIDALGATLADPDLIPEMQTYLQANLRVVINAIKHNKDLSPGLMELLDHIFNHAKRFYTENGCDGSEIVKEGKWAVRNTEMPTAMPSVYQIENINFFGTHDGFTAISDRLVKSLSGGDGEEGKEDTEPGAPKDSFIVLTLLIKAVANVKDMLHVEFAKPYVTALDLTKVVSNGLAHITDTELKTDLSDSTLNQLTTDVRRLLRLTSTDDAIAEYIEKIHLDIALRLLSADVLKQKINGMTQLSHTIESINKANKEKYQSHGEADDDVSVDPADDLEVGPQLPAHVRARAAAYGARGGAYGGANAAAQAPVIAASKYLTADYMIDWMAENKVVEVVLDTRQHEQVIKRSPLILKFLAQHNALTSQHIDLLWATAAGKHEDVVRIVYNTLADIAEELDEDQLDFLMERINKKPFEEYKDFDMQYVKLFTMNAVKATRGKNKYYGLDIFWQMIQESSNVIENIRDQARVVLRELLGTSLFAVPREVYALKCIQCIETNTSGTQAIALLKDIVSLNEKKHQDFMDVISGQTKVDIVDILLTYLTKIQAPQTKTISGRDAALDFLQFVMQKTSVTMTVDQLNTLWSALVIHAVNDDDITACLSWLKEAAVPATQQPFDMLGTDALAHVFEQLLCKEHKNVKGEQVPINMAWYTCFETFFAAINYKRECLLNDSTTWLVITNFEKLVGVDMLWRFTRNSDPAVSKQARHFLTTVHIRLDFNFTNNEKKDIYSTFVTTCMSSLATLKNELEEPGKTAIATDTVSLLAGFVDRVESGEALKRPLFFAGERVRAFWKSSRPSKYGAVVKEVNPDGSYQVRYDDNDFDPLCPESNLFTPEDRKKEAKVTEQGDAHLYPRLLLSSKKDYFDLFFELLGKGQALGHRVWGLLKKIPTNVDLRTRIAELREAKSVDWNALLPAEAVNKLLYTLQIVQSNVLVEPSKDAQAQDVNVSVDGEDVPPEKPSLARQKSMEVTPAMQKWCFMFVQTNGFTHLYNLYMAADPSSMFSQGELPTQCYHLVLKLLLHFLIGNANTIGVEGTKVQALIDASAFVNKLLTTLQAAVKVDVPSKDKTQRKLLAETVLNLLKTVGALLTINPALLKDVYAFKEWPTVVTTGLMGNQNKLLRIALQNSLVSLCTSFDDAKKYPQQPVTFFQPILLAQLAHVDTASETVHAIQYFAVLRELLTSSKTLEESALNVDELATALTKMIRQHPLREVTEKDHDPVLVSLFQLTQSLVKKLPKVRDLLGAAATTTTQGEGNGSVSLLEDIVTALFALPDMQMTNSFDTAAPPPKCKSQEARQAAFALLNELCAGHSANTLFVTTLLEPNHLQIHSGGTNRKQWKFSPVDKDEKGREGYVGLRNLGCICYMNASVQQMFMIPKLRANILAVDTYEETDLSKSLVYNLQYLMGHLQESGKQYINPKPFTDCLPDETGKPINVGRQEDASGFLTRFIDLFESKVKGSSHVNAFKQVMGFKVHNQLYGAGSDCPHFKYRESDEYILQVDIKNKKILKESLEASVEPELLEGYKCERCNKKVDTNKRAVMGTLPPTLCIALKRFELDYTTWQSVKVNDRLEFPMELDMREFTAEYCTTPEQKAALEATTKLEQAALAAEASAKESAKEGKAPDAAPKEAKSGDKPSDPEPTTVTPGESETSSSSVKEGKALEADEKQEEDEPLAEHPDEYYQYKLMGVVVHTGTAHGGHYYSFIRERLTGGDPNEAKWYKFNDNLVTEFDPKNIPDECYGGAKAKGWGGVANGYLLFYDRVEPSREVKVEDATTDKSELSFEAAAQVVALAQKIKKKTVAMRSRAKVPPKIFSEIWDENLTYWRDKNVYDGAYFEFLWDLTKSSVVEKQLMEGKLVPTEVKDVNAVELSTPADERDALTRLITRFVLMTLSRAAQKDSLGQWLGQLKKLYANNVHSSVWLLNILQSKRSTWLYEFMFTCPNANMRHGMAELVALAIKNVAPLETDSYTKVEVVPESPDTASEGKDEVIDALLTGDVMSLPRASSRGYVVGYIDSLLGLFRHIPQHYKKMNDYFKLLGLFANLGPAERAYLHKAHNIVPRLINIYLGPRSSHPELSETTLDAYGQKVVVSMESPELTGFYTCLAALCKDQAALSPLAKEMLHSKAFLQPLMMDATKEQSVLLALFSSLAAQGDVEFNQTLCGMILESLALHSTRQCRPIYRVVRTLLALNNDTFTETLMNGLVDVMKEGANIWRPTDFHIEFIVRFAMEFPAVRAHLQKTASAITWMTEWLNAHPNPPKKGSTGGMLSDRPDIKAGSATLLFAGKADELICSSKHTAFGHTRAQKLAFLTKLASTSAVDASDGAYDSDTERTQRTFQVDQDLDVLDTDKTWLAAKVCEVKFDAKKKLRIYVTYVGFAKKWDEWIHADSCRIAPPGTFSKFEPKAK